MSFEMVETESRINGALTHALGCLKMSEERTNRVVDVEDSVDVPTQNDALTDMAVMSLDAAALYLVEFGTVST